MWWILWLSLMILFAVLEAATPQLTTIWFAVGAGCAMVASLIVPDMIWIHIIVFVVISAIAVVITRPLAKKILKNKADKTNSDRFIDEEGVVTEDIDNVMGKGLIKSKGTVWSAKAENDNIKIPKDTLVKIIKIEGVKVIVKPLNKESEE